MIDRARTEFSLSASPTAEVDAQEAFGRVLTGETAVLRDRAMLLISGLLTSEEGPTVTMGNDSVSVKVCLRSELGSGRDQGFRVGGRAGRAQEAARTHIARVESSSPEQDRRSMGVGLRCGRGMGLVRAGPPAGSAAHARLDPAIALWMSFVSRSVQTRRGEVAKVRLRVASQWEALGRSRAMTEHNRAMLTQRSSA